MRAISGNVLGEKKKSIRDIILIIRKSAKEEVQRRKGRKRKRERDRERKRERERKVSVGREKGDGKEEGKIDVGEGDTV